MADLPDISPKSLWQAADDVDPVDANYLREMVTSQASVMGLVGALGVGAVLSIPLGIGVGAIPIIAAVAAESVAALFVPSSPVFREFVNRRRRIDRREAVRRHMVDELSVRTQPTDRNWTTYGRMRERLDSLQRLAKSRGTALTPRNVEDLDDVTVDFLGLWVALLAMRERFEGVQEPDLQRRLAEIETQLAESEDALDRKHLERAAADLGRVLGRRKSVKSRATAVEAAMLSMADTFEEVFQRVIANPASTDASSALDDAVDRMRVEEALDFQVDSELEDLFRTRRAAGTKTL